MQTTVTPGRGRGFASLSPERRKAIASQGGKTAWERGTAHCWTPEQAREAGRIGGLRKKGHRRIRKQEEERS